MEEEKVRCSSRLIGLLGFSFRDTNITQRGGKGQIPILSLSLLYRSFLTIRYFIEEFS